MRTRPPSRLCRLRRTAVCGDGRQNGTGGLAGGGSRVRHRHLAAGVRADIERRKRVDARAGRPARQAVIWSLRSKFSSANLSSKSRALPKAFTEKGLYMLATVLKSRQAIEATFAIIETFANVRAMKRELLALHTEPDAKKRDSMMRHFGEALTDIVMPDLTTAETESSMEINFLIGKLKHTVRRVRKVK